jgi:DNA invertase Pin-like site-specific DNA recombinase
MVETHPKKRLIGYARVSTYGQTLDSQLEQLRAAGCSSRNIYREKVTGARANRRELLRMLRRLVPGDMVTVTRIDRLARSTCSASSSASWTRRRNSGHWRNRGPTPAPAPGG